MNNVKIFIPRVGYETIKSVIINYYDLNRSVTLAEIAAYSKETEGRFSKSHAFLEDLGIIKGKEVKIITELGSRLGAALKYNQADDVKILWNTIINNHDFFDQVITKLSQGDMPEVDLINYIHYLTETPKTKDTPTGAKAILRILVEADFITFSNGKYQITKDIKLAREEASRLVFVIMAIRPEMDYVFKGIEVAAERFGLKAKRVIDEQGDYRITDRIISMIKSARLIIADLSYERPNVYFELGYARGYGQTVITVAREGTNLHFDVKDWTCIFYADSRSIENELVKRLKHELNAE